MVVVSKPAKVLVVYADEQVRSSIASLLRHWEYLTEIAIDGAEGLAKVQSFKPDIILASRDLPPTDGEQFLQEAQREDPTIGMFLFERSINRVTPIKLGEINYLSLPINADILEAQLRGYLEGRHRPSGVFHSYSSIRILIVDDEENVRTGIAALMSHWGYQIDTAKDGIAGLEKVESFRPDVVITDMKMPRMDGLNFFKKVHARYPTIGFFMVSAYGTIHEAVEAVKLGAITYQEKPIDFQILRARLQAYLDSRQPPLRVFLCHTSADKPAARKLYRRLKRDRIDAWLDEDRLIPGQKWDIEIQNAVRGSDVVIVCLSHTSVNKEGYIQKEIRTALDLAAEKPDEAIFLIPAKLEECQVPDRLSAWQWVNLFEPNGYARLLAALRKRAGMIPLKL